MASKSRALTPTLTGPQLAAVVNEVAASSPIAETAVAQACERQANGIVRTRSATLYATGQIPFAAAAAAFTAGQTVDLFNVPIGQVGSGFAAAITKAQTNMTQAGLLASEAFSVDKIGFQVNLSEADGAELQDDVASLLNWVYNNTVAELHLGGQDVQLLGLLGHWPDTVCPQSYTASTAAANSAFMQGFSQSGYDAGRPYELFIPQQVPFKVKLTIPQASAFAGAIPTGAGNVEIRCSMYGTSVTAIQA